MLAIMEASNKDAQGLASGDCAGVYGARHVGREADGNLGRPPPSAFREGRGSGRRAEGKAARRGGGSQTAP